MVGELFDKYPNVLVCEIKDLPANIVHRIRHELRTVNAEVLCGKTTVVCKALKEYIDAGKFPKFHNKEALTTVMDGIHHVQLMLIYTTSDLAKVNAIISKYKIEKQAKVGAASPIDVTLKAGPTGMDSSQIEMFQALKIQTKVIKNQLEIINDAKVLVVGQKINISEINLMKKFNIKPYVHNVVVRAIYLGGKTYGPEILKINDEHLKTKVLAGIKNVACFSLQTNCPTKASAPHTVMTALTNMLGLKNHCGIEVAGLKGGASAPAAAPKKEEPKKEEKKKKAPEPEPEDDDLGGMGDLFG